MQGVRYCYVSVALLLRLHSLVWSGLVRLVSGICMVYLVYVVFWIWIWISILFWGVHIDQMFIYLHGMFQLRKFTKSKVLFAAFCSAAQR